ncbi:MAG: hypothetical protein J2P41_08040 [Blastocatellia bacterium]|nr:hypothetical protein [Blastocatellia bacterium]
MPVESLSKEEGDMNFISLQYLRFITLTLVSMACAANAQTNDRAGSAKISTDYCMGSPCITGQSQLLNNSQDQSTSDPQKSDSQKPDSQKPDNQKPDNQKPDTKKKDDATSVNILTGMGHVSQAGYKPLTGKQRFRLYLNQTFVPPQALLGPLFSAGLDQINHDPPEWKLGAEGYGRRLAFRFGTNFVANSIQALGAAALHQEPRYISSSSKGFFHRSGHALLFTLVTYNNNGKVTPAIANIGSTYAASMIGTYWLPKRYTALGDGVRDGNVQLGFNGVFNLFEEFWPDIKKKIFK